MATIEESHLTVKKPPTIEKRVALFIAGLNIVLLLVGIILGIIFSTIDDSTFIVWEVLLLVINATLGVIVYTILAVMIISRHPLHMIGWLFLIVGFSSTLVIITGALSDALQSNLGNSLVEYLIDLLSAIVWLIPFLLPISLVLLYYPDGRLPSKRWWPIVLAIVIGLIVQTVSIIFRPWPFEAHQIASSYNPLAIDGSEQSFDTLDELGNVLLIIGLIGSLAALIVRFFRSQRIERQQIKWLVYTAGVGMSTMFLLSIFLAGDNPILSIVFLSLPMVIAITIGLAILRYRLFDIDVIIRRTLQYAILTGILALIYFGLVVMLQALFSAVGDQQSPIFIVISTLVIAGLFNPLRIRIQNVIDRRFYRKKYRAKQALAQFAAAARDEVDLDRLSAELVEVVQETMQPATIDIVLISHKKKIKNSATLN